MSAFLVTIIEICTFLGLYLLAFLITAPLRRARRPVRPEGSLPAPHSRRPLARLGVAAAVLVLSLAVFWLARLIPGVAEQLAARPGHREAWLYFWGVVLLIELIEGLVIQLYHRRGRPFPIPDLLEDILRAILFIAVALVILHVQLHYDIVPLLASTAVLTVVLGFALQGVLGNLLAGMSLHVVRSLAPRDWVRIDDIEGCVIGTNWRETRLRTIDDHILIVPNSRIAEATVHNMSRPDPLRRHAIEVQAGYEEPPGEVLAALLAAAQDVPAVLGQPAPRAFVTGYLDFGLSYRINFWTEDYGRREQVDSDVARMIWYKFKRAGIEIPFPMSDQVLNDLVDVIDHRKKQEPDAVRINALVRDMQRSRLCTELCAGEAGAAPLAEEELRQVAPHVRRLRYTAGETVLRQGDPGTSCYLIVRGNAHGTIRYAGTQEVMEFDLASGDILGEMSLILQCKRTATIRAADELELLELGEEALLSLLDLREDVGQALARLAASRAAESDAYGQRLEQIRAELQSAAARKPGRIQRLWSSVLHLLPS